MMARSRLVWFGVFLLFAGWDIWEAAGNLIGLPPYYEAVGFVEFIPWWLLIGGFVVSVLPPLIGLWWIRRALSLGEGLVGLVVILAAHAAVSISVLAAEQAWRAQVLQGLMG